MFLYGIANYLVDRHYHPLAASSASFDKLLVFFPRLPAHRLRHIVGSLLAGTPSSGQ